MKRYLVFLGMHYYPDGGISDMFGEYDTIEECMTVLDKRIMEDFNPEYRTLDQHIESFWEHSWCHIYDTEKKEKIWEK